VWGDASLRAGNMPVAGLALRQARIRTALELDFMDTYPDWLGRDLLAGTLPWAQALPSSMAAFLDRFDLHDSTFVGLFAEAERDATLLLRWLLPDDAAEWLLLAVRFDGLERSEVKLRSRGIASAVSGPTSRAADWHRTHLEDRRGGGATLLHAPGVRLLCLTPDRAVRPLPVPAETL
jgi:hypothetical protein